MAYLEFHQVSFYYEQSKKRTEAIQNVSLTLNKGEFCCLIGRSGCGKSTLLKLAAGLLEPSAGIVLLDGEQVKAGQHIGLVFQTPTLLEWHTVLDNVLLPVTLNRRPLPADREHAMELLKQMGIDTYADRHPHRLSGGQQSRVALARALMLKPKLLLLDEPFAALDALTREELQEQLSRIVSDNGMTALFVTHDIGEAVFLADRVAAIRGGRLGETVPVSFERPRPLAFRYSPDFLDITKTAREALEGE